jgi:hypothetical protein
MHYCIGVNCSTVANAISHLHGLLYGL